jgi:PST family polysaccharide transporter
MGADYYPRLTGVADDKIAVNRMVNEQTEIGLLLAVPGLLATLALAPWIIRVFYTVDFLPAVELLQWFILGCLGRVISWPLGFVMLALGKGRWFFITETSFNLLHVGLILLGLLTFGLTGVAFAFFVMYICYTIVVFVVVRHLTGFNWTSEATTLNLLAIVALIATFTAVLNLALWPATIVGTIVTLITTIYCLRGLIHRLGGDHKVALLVYKIPGLRAVLNA